MVTTGNYLQVIDEQRLIGVSKPILNVYYLEVTATTGTPVLNSMPAEVELWMDGWLFSEMLPVQSNQLTHVKVTVNNLADYEEEFVEVPYEAAYQGGAVSDYQASGVAWSFQLTRLFRTTRNGRKSIAGVPENLTTANAASAGAVPLLAALAAAMDNPPAIGAGGDNEIFVRLVIPKTPVPPATIPTIFNPVSTVTFRGIGSQNSRKQLLS